jgi:hypothetical protein
MFYNSIISLGLGEIGPVNNIELAFCYVSMLLSALMTSLIFGEVAVLISMININ